MAWTQTRRMIPPLTGGVSSGFRPGTEEVGVLDVPHWVEALRGIQFPHGLGVAIQTPSCRRKGNQGCRRKNFTKIHRGEEMSTIRTDAVIFPCSTELALRALTISLTKQAA